MTRELTAFEVLEIAEKMEDDAARFYGKAAEAYDDPSIAKLFSELAQWEKRHVQVFAEMKDHLSQQVWEEGRFTVERVNLLRLHVPPTVFNEHSEPAQELAGTETRADVLKLAIKKERYAIDYYTALAEFALGPDNIKVIRGIVQEERKHVRILAQSLGQNADY